jgi:hypothetical protein
VCVTGLRCRSQATGCRRILGLAANGIESEGRQTPLAVAIGRTVSKSVHVLMYTMVSSTPRATDGLWVLGAWVGRGERCQEVKRCRKSVVWSPDQSEAPAAG